MTKPDVWSGKCEKKVSKENPDLTKFEKKRFNHADVTISNVTTFTQTMKVVELAHMKTCLVVGVS